MQFHQLFRALRLPAVALFSVFLYACGQGEGPEEVVDPLFAGGALPVVVAPTTTPTVAAPTPPARAPADVVSLFSDAYTDVTVDTWAAGFSAATLADVMIAGNATKEYTALGFAGIEFLGGNAIDITGMTHFHMDLWTADIPEFLFKFVDFGGDGFGGGNDTEGPITLNAGSTPALTASTWVSVDIPIADMEAAGLTMTANDLNQLIIDAIPDGGSIYIDNVYFYNSGGGGGMMPTVAAPTPPARNPADVVSLFSDAYTDVTVDTWAAGFSNATFADVMIAGNATKEYTALGFAGIEFLGGNAIDITGMTHFHIDLWTPDIPEFLFKFVDFGGDGFGGGNDTEGPITLNAGSTPALTAGTWVSVDIPITDMEAAGLTMTANDLNQLIIDAIPDGGAIYIDNVYFYTTGPVTVPPVAAPTPPARNPADVVSLFSDAYTDVTVDTWAAGFSNTSFSDVMIAGNPTKEYTALGFAGIEFLGGNAIDITGMTHFHIDLWTPDIPEFLFKFVDFGGDGFGGGNDTEGPITLNGGSTPALAMGSWVSVDIPITDMEAAGLTMTANDLNQLIIDAIPDGGAMYIDNVYFYTAPAPGGNLAVNGDVETGDLSGWTLFPSASGVQEASTSNPNSGTYSARIQNTQMASASIIKQANIGVGTVSAGQTVYITFSARGSLVNGAVAFAEFFCEVGGGGTSCAQILGGGPLGLDPDPNVWTDFSFTYPIPGGADVSGGITLQLTGTTGGAAGSEADVYYDDICISTTMGVCP